MVGGEVVLGLSVRLVHSKRKCRNQVPYAELTYTGSHRSGGPNGSRTRTMIVHTPTSIAVTHSVLRFVHPKLVDSLDGEELVQIASSEGHCAAVSVGGDCFTWGDNTYCQLGLRSTLAASALPPSSSSSEPESDSDDDVLGDGAALSARGPLSRKPSRHKHPGVSRGPASHGKPSSRSPPKKLSRVQMQRMQDTRKHVPTSQLVDLPVGEYAQQVSLLSPTSAHNPRMHLLTTHSQVYTYTDIHNRTRIFW